MNKSIPSQIRMRNTSDSPPVGGRTLLRRDGRDQHSAALRADQTYDARRTDLANNYVVPNKSALDSVLLAAPHFSADLTRIPLHGAAQRPPLVKPRLRVSSFSGGSSRTPAAVDSSTWAAPRTRWDTADKSLEPLAEDQDKMLATNKFATHPRGVKIEVDASTAGATAVQAGIGALGGLVAGGLGLGIAGLAGATLGTGLIAGVLAGGAALGALAGGAIGSYRYTQTIDTNVPLGGPSSPYVDPRPNDDNKPFYWTDAEHEKYGTVFRDAPSRGIPASGTTRWDATLSITRVVGKSVTILESLTYGFSLDSAGAVTARAPSSISAAGTHISTLASEFPDWTFKQG